MIKRFIRKVNGRFSIASPDDYPTVPSGSTAVERRAIQGSAEAAGAHAFLIEGQWQLLSVQICPLLSHLVQWL